MNIVFNIDSRKHENAIYIKFAALSWVVWDFLMNGKYPQHKPLNVTDMIAFSSPDGKKLSFVANKAAAQTKREKDAKAAKAKEGKEKAAMKAANKKLVAAQRN